jgi:4-amino-4-deoxy-L-arabinose transferase-like glycosyltransferase
MQQTAPIPSPIHSRRWLKTLLSLVWLSMLVGYILAGVTLTPFHGDESTQIFMSRDFQVLFLDQNLESIGYEETPPSPTEQELRLLNGTVNKFLIGLMWHLNGDTVDDLNDQWDWGADWNYNQQNGHAPGAALLQLARWPSAVLLAAGVIFIFLIGQQIGGHWAAYLASLYYALNPALLLNGRRAMMEGSLIAFSVLTMLAGIWLLQQPSLRRTILLGIAAGLALASKHTALFTVGAVYSGALMYLIYQSLRATEEEERDADFVILPYLVLAAAVTIGVFLLLNPTWWSNPLAVGTRVFELRQNLLTLQTDIFPSYTNQEQQVAGFLRQSLLVLPQYYEVAGWEQWIGDQISQYEASPWRGLSVGGSLVGAIALCGMMAVGGWSLLRDRTQSDAARWLVGLWFVVTVLTTWRLTPLEWQRYYLPLYPVVGLLAATGVSTCIRWLQRTAQARRMRDTGI